MHEIDEAGLSVEDRDLLDSMEKKEVIRKAMPWDLLSPEQEYAEYPARFRVELTDGEPLIREDFLDIIDALAKRDIGISTIFTNGWLVDEKLLDALDARKMHPSFQLNYYGVGKHDFLRGIVGAEERALRALKLLHERKYLISVSLCLHEGNANVLRESVKLMASYGVMSMKCGTMMELGEWTADEVKGLQLSREEQIEVFEKYIPQYFENDAPLRIMLADTFMYTPGDKEWQIYSEEKCSEGYPQGFDLHRALRGNRGRY